MKKLMMLMIAITVIMASFTIALDRTSSRSKNLMFGVVDGVYMENVRSSTSFWFNEDTQHGRVGLILKGKQNTLRISGELDTMVDFGARKVIAGKANYATIKHGRNTQVIKNPTIRVYISPNYKVISVYKNNQILGYGFFR